MPTFRVANEGIKFLDVENSALPVPRKVQLWEGDHQPTLDELREIIVRQPTTEELETTHGMANFDTFMKEWGPEDYTPSPYWNYLLIERRRTIKYLGWKTLGVAKPSTVFVENDEDYQLETYWRDKPIEWTRDMKSAAMKVGGIILGLGAAAGGIELIDYFTHK